MRISYNKLWKMLIDKNMKKSDLKEKAGINAVSSFYYNRVAPWACRILGSDHIIVSLSLPSFGNEGIDDIKGSLVVTDTGSP